MVRMWRLWVCVVLVPDAGEWAELELGRGREGYDGVGIYRYWKRRGMKDGIWRGSARGANFRSLSNKIRLK